MHQLAYAGTYAVAAISRLGASTCLYWPPHIPHTVEVADQAKCIGGITQPLPASDFLICGIHGPQVTEAANSPKLREWFPLPGAAPPAKQLKALDEGRLPSDMQGFAVHTRRTFAVRPAPPPEVRALHVDARCAVQMQSCGGGGKGRWFVLAAGSGLLPKHVDA